MLRQLFGGVGVAVMIIGTAVALGQGRDVGSATSLRASYAALRAQLEQSPFGKPLHLESTQSSDNLKGDIHALIDQPFETVRSGLRAAQSWCHILILHPNITNCRLSGGDAAMSDTNAFITVYIGKRGTPVAFSYDVAAAASDYLNVQLAAGAGPLGTTDYRIKLEATPLDRQHTILHLVYSHGYGVQARIAMRAYLGTLGRGKVGFTVLDRGPDGRPVYVSDFRGALERNAMRYYLSIEAYLESLSSAPQQQFEKRLQTWFAYTKRYPLQLHEDNEYLDLKRKIARAP